MDDLQNLENCTCLNAECDCGKECKCKKGKCKCKKDCCK